MRKTQVQIKFILSHLDIKSLNTYRVIVPEQHVPSAWGTFKGYEMKYPWLGWPNISRSDTRKIREVVHEKETASTTTILNSSTTEKASAVLCQRETALSATQPLLSNPRGCLGEIWYQTRIIHTLFHHYPKSEDRVLMAESGYIFVNDKY